jgi:mannose-6-phosphate isomerase-like protein (cupin superfamily)
MSGYHAAIENLTIQNSYFRHVLFTGKYTQLVLMNLKPKEDIGMEVHEKVDQFFRFEKGNGKVIIDESNYDVKDGDAIIVPAGAQHNIINISENEDLKLYTLYSPPNHPDGTIHKTKEDAMGAEEEHH